MVRYRPAVGRPDMKIDMEDDDEDTSATSSVETEASPSTVPTASSDLSKVTAAAGESGGDASASPRRRYGRGRQGRTVSFLSDMAFMAGTPGTSLYDSVVKVRPLGRGQFGQVWLAFHAPTQRLVALKEVSVETSVTRRLAVSEVTENAKHARRLSGSARRARHRADVVSEHVLTFFGSFVDPEKPSVGLVLEYMNGGSLDQFLGEGRALACERALQRVAVGSLRGLSHLHARSVCHRDVKPANVLVDFNGDVKIGDLGVATLMGTPRSPSSSGGGRFFRGLSAILSSSGAGAAALSPSSSPEASDGAPSSRGSPRSAVSARGTEGTLGYFSPERARGGAYDAGADVWALGATLVAGRRRNQSPVDGRPGISPNPSTSPKSNSFPMILEPLSLASRVLDDKKKY